MKKIIAVLAIVAVSVGGYALLTSSHDHADHAHEDRVDHYEGQTIETKKQAIQILQESNGKIAKILKAKELDTVELEEIHEISYTLEAAIDKLIAEKAATSDQLESIDEAIQAVHYASENHEEAKVREWFAKLEPAAGNLDIKSTKESSTDKKVYEIVIKDHTFTPAEVRVPAGEKIKLVVHNQDPTPEEFESDDFRREKIIAGNSKATILVGPLKPGKYHFFGEFNLDKANGYLIVE